MVIAIDTKSKSLRSMRQDCGDHKQGDVQEKDSSLHKTEAPASSSRNLTPSVLQTHKETAKQEPSVAHLDLNNDKAGDAPKSGTEVLKGIGSMRAGYSVILSPKKDSSNILAVERKPNTLELNNPEKLL